MIIFEPDNPPRSPPYPYLNSTLTPKSEHIFQALFQKKFHHIKPFYLNTCSKNTSAKLNNPLVRQQQITNPKNISKMKKVALFLAIALGAMSASAQNIAKNELKQLQAFLAQPAAEATTNAEALKISDYVLWVLT